MWSSIWNYNKSFVAASIGARQCEIWLEPATPDEISRGVVQGNSKDLTSKGCLPAKAKSPGSSSMYLAWEGIVRKGCGNKVFDYSTPIVFVELAVAINASQVSFTKLKSLVGSKEPSFNFFFFLAIWVII